MSLQLFTLLYFLEFYPNVPESVTSIRTKEKVNVGWSGVWWVGLIGVILSVFKADWKLLYGSDELFWE